MKNLKKLLGSMLALLLVFSSLSAGMVVLAAETAVAATPFASFEVDGKSVDLNKYPVYSLLNYKKSSAKVTWSTNQGWEVESASYEWVDDKGHEDVQVKSGGKVKLPKNGGSELAIVVKDANGNTKDLALNIYTAKCELVGDTLWKGDGENCLQWEGVNGDAEVVSLKSSNSSVLKVKKAEKLWDCTVTPKGVGKAKVTVKVKVNGKNKSISANYTVKKYPNALTQIKVNGKAVDLKNNKFEAQVKVTKEKNKVEFKLAKGWRLNSSGYIYDGNSKFLKLRSGGTVKLTKAQSRSGGAWVNFVVSKGDDTFWYTVTLVR